MLINFVGEICISPITKIFMSQEVINHPLRSAAVWRARHENMDDQFS